MSYALAIAQGAAPYATPVMNRMGDVAFRQNDGRGYNIATQIAGNLVANRRSNEAEIEINRDRNRTELEIQRGNQSVQRGGQLLNAFDAAAAAVLNFRGQDLQRSMNRENNVFGLTNRFAAEVFEGIRNAEREAGLDRRTLITNLPNFMAPQIQAQGVQVPTPPPPNLTVSANQPQQPQNNFQVAMTPTGNGATDQALQNIFKALNTRR